MVTCAAAWVAGAEVLCPMPSLPKGVFWVRLDACVAPRREGAYCRAVLANMLLPVLLLFVEAAGAKKLPVDAGCAAGRENILVEFAVLFAIPNMLAPSALEALLFVVVLPPNTLAPAAG